jgi:uncharacterized protein HemY
LGLYDDAEKVILCKLILKIDVLRKVFPLQSLLEVLKTGNDVGTLCSLGALKKKQSQYSDAKRYLEDALKLVPRASKPWIEASMSLADCLRKTEQYEVS